MKRNSFKRRMSTFLVCVMLVAILPNLVVLQKAAAAGALPDGTLPTGWNAADIQASGVSSAPPTAPVTDNGAIYVAPGGLDTNPGTLDSPTTLESAIMKVAPGEIIYLRGGSYSYSAPIIIGLDNSGNPNAKKHIFAYGSERPVLDFSSQAYDAAVVSNNGRGLQINGSYWYIKGIEVKGSADNGIYIAGHYNRVENSEVHHNRDTGLQIGRYASTAPKSEWPSYNEIVNVYSHDNFDPDNGEDADGFAAKLTVGPGNLFDGCIAAYNVDDGWDLYSKTETGAISPVTIRNSIAHHNGQTSEGHSTSASDGNGFKLGGEKIPVDHIVIHSIAFQNKKHGFTYNSNPGSITMTNNTSYSNGQSNFAFDLGTHQFTNNLSYKGSSSDKTSGSDVESSNVWWKNNKSTNAKGLLASDADFVSLTPTLSRNADGSPYLGTFLQLAGSSSLKGAGTPSGTDIGAVTGSTGTAPIPTATPTPTSPPTVAPTVAPTAVPTPTAPPSGPNSEYQLTGFAYGATGGGSIPDTDPRYKKVYNAADFADAINRKKGYKVIEIMNDLNLGWNELDSEVKSIAGSLIVSHNAPQTHPVLLQTGVSKVYLDTLKDVTIYSANGSKIKHAAFVLKYSSNVLIRNLEFDELWEWDEASKGDYDKNDWDYITIEGSSSKIWIDHCTFNKAYDGVIDVKKGSNGVTISWSMFRGDDRSPDSWVTQQIQALEANRTNYTMYNTLRNLGLSTEDIIAVVSSQKKGHLVGSTGFASDNPNLEVTLHHNYYKDMQDRMPRLRGGNIHVYNIVMDSADARAAGKRITSEVAAAISSKGYKFGVTSNGAISTENGAVLVEKSIIVDVLYPIRNNQTDPNNSQYTGKILAVDTIYSLDGVTFRGNSDTEGSPLTPVPAPVMPFSWNGFETLPYGYVADDPATLPSRLLADNGSGAGRLFWNKENWLSVTVPEQNIDQSAPVTVDDAPKRWVNHDITVNLHATDTGSGVAATYYTIGGGAPKNGNRVTFTNEGIYTLVYWSVDQAGNAEEKKSITIQLDKTAPVLEVTLDKTTLWPANNKLAPVTAILNSSDHLSGIDSIVLTSITPSIILEEAGPMVVEAQYGTLDTTFSLMAKKAKDKMTLVYTVKYTAIDQAGNKTEAITTVEVPHDQSGRK